MTKRKPTNSAYDLLAAAGERVTAARTTVLDILLAASQALTHQEIESIARRKGLGSDRVTLYRVLDWLVGKGLAHKITAEDRVSRYNALRQEDHRHAHFHCTHCGRTICLDKLNLGFKPSLPAGYRLEGVDITIQGRCPHCKSA